LKYCIFRVALLAQFFNFGKFMFMENLHFAMKLIPNRPDFAFSMTEEERNIMQAHVDYWAVLMNQGKVIVLGPVMDPAGPYGFSVVRVGSEEEVKQFIQNDPAAAINKYEYYPMRAVTPAGGACEL
jgi:uncharacterized protein